jgi:hypothetical protein
LSRLSLLPCCFYPQIYIPWIQTYVYICSFNTHTLYLLYGCLKIISAWLAHSVYLLGCGLQDQGYVGRFQEVLIILCSPKYPDRLWAYPTSLEIGDKTVSRRQCDRNFKPNTHLVQVQRLRQRGAIPLLSPYPSLAFDGTTVSYKLFQNK